MLTGKTGFTFSLISALFFFITTPIIIIISLSTLLSLDTNRTKSVSDVLGTETNGSIFASLPDDKPSTYFKLIPSDARGDIVKNFLSKYNSPLEPYAYYIVNMADQNEIDFRLIASIARQESNLCKFIPENTYNCWGWGIHSRGTLGFSSYEEGIKIVTEGLKKDYINKGYNTPDEIMRKYTPLSDGSWAKAVNQFMQEME